ncbi:MAG: XDD3 family exosortase-dependent surface protein [Leptodesmis sp.]|uniref:XDD3 family exosortase-dependent surface protein n=1 Tax=Leptodesmis sp. TaxID=3100501 RepID=UPI003D0BA67E
MFAVRFAASNDSPVALGLYSGVQTQSVALQNLGYSSLQQYYNAGFNKNQTQGSALATKDAAFNYYGTGSIQTSIASGTKIGDVNLLTAQALSAMGLNFGANMGSQTFGFSIDKSLLPSSSFLANIYMECGNDGMAYSASATPEPMTMGGAALGIAAIGGLKRMRRRKEGTAS